MKLRTSISIYVLCLLVFISCSDKERNINKRTIDNKIMEFDLSKNDTIISATEDTSMQIDRNLVITEVQVLNLRKTEDKESAFYDKYKIECENWMMSKEQIEEVLKNSRIIDGHEYHYFFDILPCTYTGEIVINEEIKSKYEVNAGSSSIIILEDGIFYFMGYYENKYFIDYPSTD